VRSTLGFRSRFAREQAIRKGGSGIRILYFGQWLDESWSAQSIWSILHSEWRFFRIFYSGGNILLRFYAFRSISEISREPGWHEQVVVGGLDDDGLGRGLGILDAQCIKTWQRTIWDWTSKTGHWTTKDRRVLLPDYCIFLNF
jgi:hypothetical protein